jgi:hypothetical protein
MKKMPLILAWTALIYYVGTVVTAIAAGQEFSMLAGEEIPWLLKARALLLVFFQPFVSAGVLLFGAAVLWRFDRWFASRVGAVEND